MLTETSPRAGPRDSVLIFLKPASFGQSVKHALESGGYRSMAVTTDSHALAAASTNIPSVMILDRRSDSVALFRRNSEWSRVPIVAVQDGPLSSQDEECLHAYEQGIDLVVGNQSVRELVARVRAILRRRELRIASKVQYSAGTLRMDLDRHEVLVKGRVVELTPTEFQILRQFLESPHRVFSRQELLTRVWGESIALQEHAVDVHIHSLRQKIEPNPARPTLVLTVRGVGYKLRA